MGRLKDFMEMMERGREEAEAEAGEAAEREDLMNRQKETDLARARARSVFRPIKKELRHSQIEGRYILPEEVKKEAEKLEKAKREAARKKGLLGRFLRRKEKEPSPEPEKKETKAAAVRTDPAKKEKDKDGAEERRQKAEQIRRLRGITKEKRRDAKEVEDRFAAVNGLTQQSADFSADELLPEEEPAAAPQTDSGYAPAENYGYAPSEEQFFDGRADYGSVPRETESRESFMESVQRLNGFPPSGSYERDFQPAPREEYFPDPEWQAEEAARFTFAPLPPDRPDGVIASALSAAVGFVYRDEDNQKVDRIITIRKLLYRQGDILIDAFCHDIAAPRLIPFSRGIRMYNLQTMRPLDDPRDFLLHRITGLVENDNSDFSGFAAALAVVRYELTALIYVAKSDFDRSDDENRLMLSYVSARCPTIDFDEREMLDYIAMLVPDEQSFAEALDVVVKMPQDIVFLFVRTFLQMMLSDGILHENERELLAELLFLLQAEGIDLGRLGLG